jgi:hypothetical protein
MKVTKSQLQKIIQEELNAVLKLRQEHRGKSCDEKTGQEKLDCEKQSKEAIEHSQKEHQKQRDYGLEDEEIKALSKGKPHHMKPPLRTRKNQIKPKDQINPDIGKELRLEKKKEDKPTCTSRADGKGMNRFHNAKGEFSSKTDSASQSVRGASNKPCKHDGQTKMNPRAWTKLPCGRKDRRNPNSKSKHRCKDGSVVNEFLIENGFVNDSSEIIDTGEWLLIRQDYLDTFTIDLMLATLEEFKEELQVETEALMSENNDNLISKCNQIGMRTFPHFIESFNRLILASKGELHKQEKK